MIKQERIAEIKASTLKPENIHFNNDFFRYTNHVDKVATTGFRTIEDLHKYTAELYFSGPTIEVMQKRYKELYGGKK